jgi:inhibitor of KinA sporulation pathway (predicted exonuclease)
MAKLERQVLIIDVEATCWEPPEFQPHNEISEIIEIGIAVVDLDSMEMIENDSIIVRPQRSKLSKFCTKLTTLTPEIVNQGVTLHAACELLKKNYLSDKRVFASWGDYDRKQFSQNCQDYNIKYPFGPRHMNLRNMFTVLHGLEKEPEVPAAVTMVGGKFDGTAHRGIDDARNIATIFSNTLKTFRTNKA